MRHSARRSNNASSSSTELRNATCVAGQGCRASPTRDDPQNIEQELLMKITTIGRGTIGGTLGRLWRSAGHEVTELGKDGGDAADADVVLLAVPGEAVPDALASVAGLHGEVVLDAYRSSWLLPRPPSTS